MLRTFASLILGLALAVAALKLAACSAVDPNPPNPHDMGDGDPPVDAGDGGEAGP